MLILQVFYVLAVLCVACGVWAIAAGLRGRWEFSSPSCSRCGYDVRAQNLANPAARCSECGSSLAGDDQVRYAARVRSRSLGRLGVGLVVIALAIYLSATSISRYVSTRRMSGQRGWSSVSSSVEDGARWSLLTADLQAGRLSPTSVDTAFADLTKHYRNQRPDHGGTAFFAASFIDHAIDSGKRRGTAKTGADGRPGAKASWPEPIATWVVQRDVAVRIVAPGEPIVDMTDDPAYDPVKANGLKVKRVYARAGQDGTDVTVEWEPLQGKPQGPCHKISIRYGTTVRDVGRLMISRAGTWSLHDSRDRWHDPLPADVTQVDILLRPDQVQAERTPELGRIWSGSVEIKGVPITRYDLAYPATTRATGGKP